MAKISRAYQKIFGSAAPGAGVGSVGKFGSLAAGSPTPSTSLSVIQALAAWTEGWLTAVIGNNGPCMEDMNGFCFVVTTQLAYLLQQGVQEWDATTPYYKGSLTNVAGILYISLTDNNVNHATTDTTYWAIAGQNTVGVAGNTVMDPVVDYYRVDASGGAVQMTLPPLAANLNKKFRVKKIDVTANIVTVKGNAAELVDFANTYDLAFPGDSADLIGQVASWDIV